jgi:hypothetical protein
MNTIGTGEHLAVGLSMGLDKPATGQAFLVGSSKPRPVDHWQKDYRLFQTLN